MKKVFSMMLASVMAFVVALSATGSVAFAADLDLPVEEEVLESATYYNGTNINTTWKKVAESSPGFNCNVYIKCMNGSILPGTWMVAPTDIRMLDQHGNVIWSESGAVAGQGDRTFWCGSDVYEIQAKCQYGLGVLYIHQA